MKTLIKLFDLLNPSERKRAYTLMFLMLIMAFMDMIGVASILPFMTVLTNPELLQTNTFLIILFNLGSHIGIYNVDQFLFALGVMVFLLLVNSLAFKMITTYAQTRFALMREYSLGKRLIESYLNQPYSWFLNRNSADLGKKILSEVNTVIDNGMLPLMTFMAQSIVAIAIIVLLLLVDPLLSLTVGLILTLAYVLIFLIISGWLNRLGQNRIQANQERFISVSEAFGAAKEVKISGLEHKYSTEFSKPAKLYAKSLTTAKVLGLLPRFALEAIAFGGMLLLILYLMYKSGSFVLSLPIISLYAFAGYRLMPALQKIYQSITLLRFVGPAVDALLDDLNSLKKINISQDNIKPLSLAKSIHLKNISYTYPNSLHPAIKNIDLNISAYSTVGFIGSTGSGKTTIVDVILGLLEPQEGDLIIDGEQIKGANRKQWLRAIGYVPQHIYLSDKSIAANIAFGANIKEIDQQAIERAAKKAKIHDFISSLPEGYNTSVGERGVRLSGGQRQRIGIARALYNNPRVLILDEATSALDNLTEQDVIEELNRLNDDITIILIAHRFNIIRNCDQIFLLEKGEIQVRGTYDQLATSSKKFKEMAKEFESR